MRSLDSSACLRNAPTPEYYTVTMVSKGFLVTLTTFTPATYMYAIPSSHVSITSVFKCRRLITLFISVKPGIKLKMYSRVTVTLMKEVKVHNFQCGTL